MLLAKHTIVHMFMLLYGCYTFKPVGCGHFTRMSQPHHLNDQTMENIPVRKTLSFALLITRIYSK
jgi:hypothetical protein